MKLSYIKPALGRIVVEVLTADERSESGLWLPSGKEQSGNAATVVAVCDPYWSAEDDQDSDAPQGPLYKVGDVVLIGKYNGIDIELGRRKVIALRESDIIGTLHEEPPV